MKHSQRLDYTAFSAVLGQRGLVEPQRLSLTLQTSMQGPIPFPEMLVGEGLIGDWELSRVVCELYGMPFLPVEICSPSEAAREGLPADFLRQHRLVPVGRYGNLLVVAMPGLVPAQVLKTLEQRCSLQVLPVVGSVQGNNRWMQENLPAEPEAAMPVASGDDWSSLFDEGDAAVLLDLQVESTTATDVALDPTLGASLDDDTPGQRDASHEAA